MRIDLADLDRLTSFASALERLFWCLMALGFLTAVVGSAGTGLLVLVLGAAAFIVRAGLEDFVRSRADDQELAAPKPAVAQKKRTAASKTTAAAKPTVEPEFTVYRTSRRPRRPLRKGAGQPAVRVEAEKA